MAERPGRKLEAAIMKMWNARPCLTIPKMSKKVNYNMYLIWFEKITWQYIVAIWGN